MSERKVQSKYIPPDYDPRLLKNLPRAGARQKESKEIVRLMIPFNIQCASCNTYMYRGRKFNARKKVMPEDYLGTSIVHFYFKCEGCKRDICFRTDPASSGYAMVSGGREKLTSTGMHNPLAGVQDPEPEAAAATQTEALSALEARAAESKREMDSIDALDRELERRNARARGADVLLTQQSGERKDEDDDEEAVRAAFEAAKRRKQTLEDEAQSRLGGSGFTSGPAAGAKPAATPVELVLVSSSKRKRLTSAPLLPPSKSLLGDAYDSDSE